MSLHPRAADFRDEARRRYGFEVDVHEFDAEETKTAALAAERVGCEVAQIASSLIFDADGELVVAITSGANRVSEDRLADHFGVESVSMASPERIAEEVGWSIGGVPPLCHESDLPTVFDPTLAEYDTVWGACGTPASMFPVDPETLRDLADATVVDVTE
jgi:prolyl-tRNA editing enzyme YbaK/EbsC (Cys-tRNA(Pro) deacylase)